MVDLAIREAVAEVLRPEVALAVVFGSAVSGGMRPESDVDVGILPLRDLDLHDELRLQVAVERAVRRRVDLVCLDRASPLLRFEVARYGELVLERLPGEWERFKARAMVDWWDWAPTARRLSAIYRERLREVRRAQS